MKINLKQFKSLFSVRFIAVAALCLILATSYIYSAMKKEITIEDIGEAKAVSTFSNTVGDVLEEKSIQIRPEDRINLDMSVKLEDGLSIKISRAREITINADGKDVNLLTVAPTVRNALEEAKVQLGEKDRVDPGLDTELTGNTKIAVLRIEEKFEKQQVKMEFTNQVK
jgi:uncharacterized protein YabE (DUF348 family)